LKDRAFQRVCLPPTFFFSHAAYTLFHPTISKLFIPYNEALFNFKTMGSKICKDKDIVSIINRQLFSNTAAGSCLGFISSQKNRHCTFFNQVVLPLAKVIAITPVVTVTQKYYTRLKRLTNNQHVSLFGKRITDKRIM